MPRMTGARPSPRHRLASAMPHRIVSATPPQWLWFPKQISMWDNDTYGVCPVSEEAFNKACDNPEDFITDATVLTWATANNALNGSVIIDILDTMRTAGFQQDGKLYNDGTPSAVDWTNTTALYNAIAQGPVKIGVAAAQLQNAVPDPPVNGWLATGFQSDSNYDHCVSLPGFGSIEWLLGQLGGSVPSGVDGTKPGIALFTWDSIGVIDWPSLQAITCEAWLRSPNSIITFPQPTKPPYAWW
jgi:hypothetical protein